MNHANVEPHEDHLVIRLDALHSVAALRRQIIVPYSTIAEARVGDPEWPAFFTNLRNGTHVPGLIALGSFRGIVTGERAFVDLARDTKRALTLKLDGHPEYDRVEVDARGTEEALHELGRHRANVGVRPPVYE